VSVAPGSGHKWLFLTSIVLGVRGGVEFGRFSVWVGATTSNTRRRVVGGPLSSGQLT
jgi:hypothetical protein